MAEYTLTDEEIVEEEKFLEGLPRMNWAAFLLPPIWGPAHGIWASILFYPVWLIADNVFYAAYIDPTPLSLVVAVAVGIMLVGITIAFGILGQPFAAHRAERLGVSRETYKKREGIWLVVCIIVGASMLALATYYNLVMRATMGA